jgi:hypothetical protein
MPSFWGNGVPEYPGLTVVRMPESDVVETVTQTLHRLTGYEPGREWTEPVDDPRIVQDLEVNVIERMPWFFKRYDLPRVPLPRDLTGLSRVLHLCAGVVRTSQRPWGTAPFRAAGSAGGRFPLEVYVADPESGVHWYDAMEHALVLVGPPPVGGGVTIVVTGVPWRTGWRYRERGWRHIYWDAGTLLSQLLAAAPSARLYSRFPDAAVTALVGADGVHEFPVAVVALDGEPSLQATGPAATGQVDAAPLEFPLVTAAQRAGEVTSLGEPWHVGEVVVDDEVILRRGSQRRMDPTRGLPREVLETCLDAALQGIDVPHFVAVHSVTGLEPGVYRWPDLSAPRRPVTRDETYSASLEQALARDAAFVVMAAADVSSLDDREYREAQLAAGLVEGRLHLMAYALGASASGMTFRDTDVPALLGEPLDALLWTCVGVPEYATRPGGLPGEPTVVRTPPPRD